MRRLVNEEDRRILKQRLENDPLARVTLSFYQYALIPNPQFFRDYLFTYWNSFGVLGRTYVATEGINAQISVPADKFEDFKEHLYSISFLNGIRLNIAVDDDGKSFFVLIIKVRNKILADGLNDETFDVRNSGKHLSAEEFNRLIKEPDTLLIDMRNHYESEVGHFKGALTPDVDTFRDSLPHIHDYIKGQENKKLVMYCTGGIRCEKASAWFKHQGFQEVYQLEGGIIEYTRQVREKGLENMFTGKNFVFDQRLAETISEEVIAKCHQCGNPCDSHTNCANEACHILFIQCDDCRKKHQNCCSKECKETIQLPIEEQRALRKGKCIKNNIFKKGRAGYLKYKTQHRPLEVVFTNKQVNNSK